MFLKGKNLSSCGKTFLRAEATGIDLKSRSTMVRFQEIEEINDLRSLENRDATEDEQRIHEFDVNEQMELAVSEYNDLKKFCCCR